MSAPTGTEWMVLQQISEELREAHVADIPADTLRWAINRYRTLLLKRAPQDARERVRA